MKRRALRWLTWVALIAIGGSGGAAQPSGADVADAWIEIDYRALVDPRRLSHSGEPVGELLRKLDGRPLPPAGERPSDRLSHALLEPLVERYAFVLPDALDDHEVPADPPFVEIAYLYHPGEAQPAWVELLRSRRYLVESDGEGKLRVFLPYAGTPTEEAPAALAWTDAWPVLRHVFAAELARLGDGGAAENGAVLEVAAYAYRHFPELSRFVLNPRPHEVAVKETLALGTRPPFDLSGLQAFLDAGLQLEGARIEEDGSLRLLGSRGEETPEILGRPLTVADFAVAYRAVSHGGLAEPYMSLDRGPSPQTATVNYGGRLRDTSLGQVSLACDIRFKTFSLGLDIVEGDDLRARLRETIPEFRTHMERFAFDPASAGILGQQTRLWFYPDRVDLTVSPQGDVLALRRVRMSAKSERVTEGTGRAAQEDPPWTRATVAAINEQYDALATYFPELADLDQAVRLLSLFTWLHQISGEGLMAPDPAGLLGAELPALYTPRTFPQMLTFNVLPGPAAKGEVVALDRLEVGDALSRLNPEDGRPLEATRRFERARAGLDAGDEQHARMLAEMRKVDPATADAPTLDFLAQRAERLRMHRHVLGSLEETPARSVVERRAKDPGLRIFSVAIGGLDLGMGSAVSRARGRSMDLAASLGPAPSAPVRRPAQGAPPSPATPIVARPNPAWRTGIGLPPRPLPDHGIDAGESERQWIRRGAAISPGETDATWILVVLGPDRPDPVSRRVRLDTEGRAAEFERIDMAGRVRYRWERAGAKVRALPIDATAPPSLRMPPTSSPEGLTLLTLVPSSTSVDAPAVSVRLEAMVDLVPRLMEAQVPRTWLSRLVVGREADLTFDQPLGGLSPLPPALGTVEALMAIGDESQRARPWDRATRPLAGEEDPYRVARALSRWWRTESGSPAAVAGTDRARSPARWAEAPRVAGNALLLLPESAWAGEPDFRRELETAWGAGEVVRELPDEFEADLVVLLTDEAPGRFASRLRELAADPSMKGKLLAGWSSTETLRVDLPAALLAETDLAGLGLAEASVLENRGLPVRLQSISQALSDAASAPARIERIPGPFLWYF